MLKHRWGLEENQEKATKVQNSTSSKKSSRKIGAEKSLFNNYSSRLNGLWVNRRHGLLTSEPIRARGIIVISKIQLVGQKYRDKTTLGS